MLARYHELVACLAANALMRKPFNYVFASCNVAVANVYNVSDYEQRTRTDSLTSFLGVPPAEDDSSRAANRTPAPAAARPAPFFAPVAVVAVAVAAA